MGAFFNARAARYDEVHTGHIAGGRASKDLVAAHLPEGTRDVLDLGCGTGLELEALFARFPDARVLGIDLAEDMLALLRTRCAGFDVSTRCMSYFDYDFPFAQFDAVISVMSLHHFSPAQKLALYQKVGRTLRPGGVFLNCDYIIGSPFRERRNFCRLRRLRVPPGEVHFDTPLTLRHELSVLRQAGFACGMVLWSQGSTQLLRAEAFRR
jgi:tRNA (cmo5U34)-methyltransferase